MWNKRKVYGKFVLRGKKLLGPQIEMWNKIFTVEKGDFSLYNIKKKKKSYPSLNNIKLLDG